jgi:hypothetical protein
MAENYTAAARGVHAVAWNPSALGLSDNSRFSFTLLGVRGGSGFGPVALSDMSDWSNRVVPAEVRSDWLSRINAHGGQRGVGDVEATWAALQVGPFAVHVATSMHALSNLTPGIAELVMFGNSANGTARDLDLGGSSLAVHAFSSIGASFGVPVPLGPTKLAVGATVKYTIGHMLAQGDDSRGAATSDPLAASLSFPLVQSDFDSLSFDNGHGLGIDVGVSMRVGAWAFGAVVKNVVSGFKWNTDNLLYRPLVLSLTTDSAATHTEAQPFNSAPADVQARVDDLGFKPVLAAGAAYTASDQLLVTADFRHSDAEGLRAGPVSHAGAGVQFRALPVLPIRIGAALVSMGENDSGWQAGAGIGIVLGPWSVGLSALRRDTGLSGANTSFMATAFSIAR